MARGVARFDGAALRAARLSALCSEHAHRLTVSCLARQVGTSKALILSYEHGRSSPSPRRLADLAQAVGVPASALQYDTQLSDLRVARGLTLTELADQLGMAVNTYRRIESTGILPKRRPGAFWDLARLLQVEHAQLHAAIRQIPAVQERRETAASLLKEVLQLALTPGPFRPLQDTSPAAEALAKVFQVASSTVSKLVNIVLSDLRQLGQQRAQLEARRDFTAHSRPAHLYERELEMVADRITEEIERVPDLLERYLVNPMPQPCWRTLAKLYLAGPSGLGHASLPADIAVALEKAFGGYLLAFNPTGASLSVPGVLFFLDTLPFYRIIYAPPERAIRPDPQSYGWPSFHARAQPQRRHRLRTAHVLGHDPHPHWDGGSWMTTRSTRPAGATARDVWLAAQSEEALMF
ncbi:helix-turn-helix transcriptional regulator [Streptomyces sp. NPDC090080]|uniref:helix-turn-helix transcriptional regulator n=1 Tax=Streptomyces sp. NPDC090080 TaxID=3365939 RepID=UPI0038099794